MSSIKKRLITGSLLIGALVAPALVLADDTAATTPAATPVATPTPLAWYQKVTVGGYLDEYYQHSFNNPSSISGPSDRAFDGTANQFTFGGGELTLKQNDAASGTGYFVDLLMGQMASTYNADSAKTDSVEIGQAYVTQAFGNATFTLGKFGTPVGYEVTYLPSNANFSRSLLFTQEPFFNTGLRLDYTLPAGLVASGFIDDGNSTDGASNIGKDYGAVLAYSGVKNLSLTGVWYLNNNVELNNLAKSGLPAPAPSYISTTAAGLSDIEWGNFIATYQAMDNLSFAGEYLFKEYSILGTVQIPGNYNPIQQGGALYATYSPIANLSISPRVEMWANPSWGGVLSQFASLEGVTAGSTVLNEYTLTVKYQMGPLAHMLEYRADASNLSDASFWTTNGTKPGFDSNLQQTLTYAAVYSF
jgi:hypothetical protein